MRKFINLIENDFEIDDEDETPEERARYDRQKSIEAAVKAFCEKEIGWEMERSYCVIFEEADNELSISPYEGEATMEQLMKLRIFGSDIRVSAAASNHLLHITIKTPPGFNISQK